MMIHQFLGFFVHSHSESHEEVSFLFFEIMKFSECQSISRQKTKKITHKTDQNIDNFLPISRLNVMSYTEYDGDNRTKYECHRNNNDR